MEGRGIIILIRPRGSPSVTVRNKYILRDSFVKQADALVQIVGIDIDMFMSLLLR